MDQKSKSLLIASFSPSPSLPRWVVSIKGKSRTKAILKLFGRRFIPKLRKECGYPEWDLLREEKYQEFVHNEGAAEFTSWLSNGDEEEYNSDEWDTAQCETYLNDQCHELFDDCLRSHEGHPRQIRS